LVDDASFMERRPLTKLWPALRVIVAVRVACDLRKLFIAAIGIIVVEAGWFVGDRLFAASGDVTPSVLATISPLGWADGELPAPREAAVKLALWVSEPVRLVVVPFWALTDPASSWRRLLHALVALLWGIVVWSLCGGAIARIAIIQVAQMRQTGLVAAVRFAIRRAGSLIAAPLCPLLGIGFCASILAAVGAFSRIPLVGPALLGIGYLFPLLIGFVIALLGVLLAAAWPLFAAAVAAGSEDALDTLSRAVSYVNQRIGPFVIAVALAAVLGAIGLVFVDLFAAVVIRATAWGLSLTNPSAPLGSPFPSGDWSSTIAVATHSLWHGLVGLLAHGWTYSFFYSAASCLYLWLRHDVDGTPWSEIEAQSHT
jgi:hypothetical protein